MHVDVPLFYPSPLEKAEYPKNIRDFVMANHPEYARAPVKYATPNMTSWKYFRKIMEERKAKQ